MKIYIIENDLLFLSKIIDAAQKKKLDSNIIRDVERIAHITPPATIVANLENNTTELLNKLQDSIEQKKITVIGYCAHVKTDIIQEAKEIGIVTLTRSEFSKKLHTLF